MLDVVVVGFVWCFVVVFVFLLCWWGGFIGVNFCLMFALWVVMVLCLLYCVLFGVNVYASLCNVCFYCLLLCVGGDVMMLCV